jgi:cyclase
MKYIKICFVFYSLFLANSLFSQNTPAYQITKITDGIYELSVDAGGYPEKVIASVGDDGILIVDSGEKENGNALKEALNTFDKGMPKIIINTHSHIEHIGGNIETGKDAVIIGHKNLRDRYINGLYVFNQIPESALPNVTFSDSLSIFFNGEEIKLLAFPGAHDNSDIIVWFTKSKVVCTEALCNNHHFPSIDGELGNILYYPEAVSKVINVLSPDVTIVPGHSADCTMKEFREFKDMLYKTSAIIKAELDKGKSSDKLIEEDILADWKSWESYVDRKAWIEYWAKAFKKPQANTNKRKVYAPIYHAVIESGVDSAIALYKYLKINRSDEYEFEERTAMFIGRRIANYLGRHEDAIKFLNICINEYPGTEAEAISNYSIGGIYWKKGDKDSAIIYYKKYLEFFPNDKTIQERVK